MTAKRAKIFKWCILVALIGYWAGMTVWARYQAREHICTGIEVEVDGNALMDSVIRAGINEELRSYPKRIVGTQVHQLNTVEIERYLTRLNNFERVNCFISPRGALVVKVIPLVPVMRVFDGNRSYYVNKDGRQIDSNAEFFSDVPVVSGHFNKTFTPKDVLPLIRYLEKEKTLRSLLGMIEARDSKNILIVPRIRGHVINFGDTTRLKEKMHALTLFYRQVMPYKGWEEYDTISVKYKGQVVATRRDKTRLNHSEPYEEEEDLEEGTLPSEDDGQQSAETKKTEEKRNEGETKKKTESEI